MSEGSHGQGGGRRGRERATVWTFSVGRRGFQACGQLLLLRPETMLRSVGFPLFCLVIQSFLQKPQQPGGPGPGWRPGCGWSPKGVSFQVRRRRPCGGQVALGGLAPLHLPPPHPTF